MNAGDLLRLIGRTFVDAAGVAQQLNAVRLDRGTLWSLMVLVVCVSVLMLHAALQVFPTPEGQPVLALSPFALALVMFTWLTMIVFSIYFTGQAMGGSGRFPGALLLMTWWQVMTIAVQAAQVIAEFLAPSLTGIVSLLGLGYLIFALLHFVNVLHGFDSLPKALGVVLVAFVGLVFGLALILALIGVGAQGGLSHV